ncbi:MAG: 50S ribosomal protein L30 [Acutalibacteraceae bacterium]
MATKASKAASLKITLKKSLIGVKENQIATAASLGLRKIGDATVQPDNEATRGKIAKVSHLVEVIENK